MISTKPLPSLSSAVLPSPAPPPTSVSALIKKVENEIEQHLKFQQFWAKSAKFLKTGQYHYTNHLEKYLSFLN